MQLQEALDSGYMRQSSKESNPDRIAVPFPSRPHGDAFTRQLSPVARPQSPSQMSDEQCDTSYAAWQGVLEQDDSKQCEPSYAAWQGVLEQACRETLRELARNAAEPEAGHGAQSIECIVRNVSERVLQEAVVCPMMHQGGPPGEANSPPPPKLLEDVVATPWVIWRESQKRHTIPLPSSSQGSSDSDEEPVQAKAKPAEPLNTIQAEIGQVEGGESTASTAPGSDGSANTRGEGIVEVRVDEGKLQVPAGLSRQDSGEQSEATSALDTLRDERLPYERIRRNSKILRRCETDPGEALCESSAWPPGTRPSSWDEDAFLFRPQIRKELVAQVSPHRPQTDTKRRVSKICLSGKEDALNVVRFGLTVDSASSTQLLMRWQARPRTCLIVAKQNDKIVLEKVKDMAAWLASQGILVILEAQLLKDHPQLRQRLHGVRTFSSSDRLEKSIDLVITVGGDGTLTWAVSLFKRAMPPVLAFAAGSLGFLTPFPLESWVRTLTNLLDLHCVRMPQRLVCRMRLRVAVMKRGCDKNFREVQCLNEVLVHRGQSGSLVKLDVGVDGEKVTLVQGDGLILATPTGSTAYSLAAGGSMVHPSVPGILLTPVSPHSLSFRPALLPDAAVITVGVPLTARCGAFISVDGKDLCALQIGDTLEVSMSPHPVPTVCHMNETKDWFSSVQDGLQWNGRVEQKAQ